MNNSSFLRLGSHQALIQGALLASLLFVCVVGHGEGIVSDRKKQEPTGGIMDVVLPEKALGPKVRRYVRLLIDSKAQPSRYVYEVPGSVAAKAEAADPAQSFKEEMARMGGESVVYLGYYGSVAPLYVKILLYAEESRLKKEWSARKGAGECEVLTLEGREVLLTKPGKMLRANLRAGMYTLEGCEGRYWVRVAPADRQIENQNRKYLLEQLERIRIRNLVLSK